jgi:hypothetical protein
VGVGGCGSQGLHGTPTSADERASFPPSDSVEYRVVEESRRVGLERLRWERTGSGAGVLELWASQKSPVSFQTRIRIVLRRFEPRSASLQIRGAGALVEADLFRTEDELKVVRKGFGGTMERSVGWGGGTALDVGSPPAAVWWIWLLAPTLEPTERVRVRTVSVRPPSWSPQVYLGELRKTPTGVVWVGPGGESTRAGPWNGAWPMRWITRSGDRVWVRERLKPASRP